MSCYSVNKIHIGKRATVSQGAHLCSASHDIEDQDFQMVSAPIQIDDDAWIAAEAFIGPGVTVGKGAVVGARAVVFKDVKPWTVVVGNPARVIKRRVLRKRLRS